MWGFINPASLSSTLIFLLDATYLYQTQEGAGCWRCLPRGTLSRPEVSVFFLVVFLVVVQHALAADTLSTIHPNLSLPDQLIDCQTNPLSFFLCPFSQYLVNRDDPRRPPSTARVFFRRASVACIASSLHITINKSIFRRKASNLSWDSVPFRSEKQPRYVAGHL